MVPDYPEDQQSYQIYNNRFVVKNKISSGSFGVVYLCQDLKLKDYVAMKVEKDDVNCSSLDREIQMLEHLQKIQGTGIPKLFWAGNEHNQNIVVMQLLGKDLSYHIKALKKFSLRCVVNIAIQVLTIIEAVHKKGIVHRDLKPENVMTGREQDQSLVYLADFGISKFYRESNGTHVAFKENKSFVGTARYASIAAHNGLELSRRDDLESIGYMIIYLFKGSLPWQTVHNVSNKDKIKMVGKIKQEISSEQLCKDCPLEFFKYFNYIKQLKFTSSPDYEHLRGYFQQIAIQNGFKNDKRLDWTEFSQGTTRISLDTTQVEQRVSKQQKDKKPTDVVRTKKNDSRQENEFKQRQQSKNKSDLHVQKNSDTSSHQTSGQQSSIFLNYQSSQASNYNIRLGSSKRLHKIAERQFNTSKGSLISHSQNSLKSAFPSQLNQQFSQQPSIPQSIQQQESQFMSSYIQEDFQDLEELEERLKKDKINKHLQKKQNQQLKVKEIQNHFQSDQSEIIGMTQMDDESLENKLKNYNLNIKFKQNLAEH